MNDLRTNHASAPEAGQQGITSAPFLPHAVQVNLGSISILGFFADHETIIWKHHPFMLFELVWVFAGALSLLTYVRITNILFKLLRLALTAQPHDRLLL
jgi:hypothetical protein